MPQPPRGTFADLYNTEQRVRSTRTGRPRRKVKRKQVTLYLTPEQEDALSFLHYTWKKEIKVDRSDIAGLAIELLHAVVERENGHLDFQTFESLKFQLLEDSGT
ncbi:MAG: hypothetical protein JXA09_13585 [Anaerolineae bacterium]|nr:hypothetical protein [Anaerolineae bacterium]